MAVPLSKPTKVKKHIKKFLRHQGDKFKRISWKRKGTWRRPRGIDSRVRRRFKSNTRTVKIGFGTQASHRHVLPNGFRKFSVNNAKVGFPFPILSGYFLFSFLPSCSPPSIPLPSPFSYSLLPSSFYLLSRISISSSCTTVSTLLRSTTLALPGPVLLSSLVLLSSMSRSSTALLASTRLTRLK